jgi:hypothetical protein
MGCLFVQINEAHKPVFLIFKRDLLRRNAGDPTGLAREKVPISCSLSDTKTLHGEKRCPRFYFFPLSPPQPINMGKSVSQDVTRKKAMSTLLLLSVSPPQPINIGKSVSHGRHTEKSDVHAFTSFLVTSSSSSIGQICVGDVT